ncbi:MAG: hypothetical protein LBJ86_00210 [Spirochaetaceae bacterium]|jgi:hypothetical protein|nr:hypothetical protein [Spirochaetaceae bacterium]
MNKQASGRKVYSGKIPIAAISELDGELTGLANGTANLTFHIRDGKLARYTTRGEGSYTEGGCSGKTPVLAVIDFEKRLARPPGLAHGTATLTLYVKDGHLARYTTGRERSHIPEGGNGK